MGHFNYLLYFSFECGPGPMLDSFRHGYRSFETLFYLFNLSIECLSDNMG